MKANRAQRGAALLTAMVIVTLVATLAAAMVWRQYRAVQIEAADRGRAQAGWVLVGALDWARLILREDARANRNNAVDHLGEPWAVPLAEARLSTFLAVDRSQGSADADEGPEAFLSGSIEDAQSRFNLQWLLQDEPLLKQELAVLQRLAESAQISRNAVETWARRLRDACKPRSEAQDTPLCPKDIEQLAWLGVDAEQRKRLGAWLVMLPQPTPLNLNTAPREVIAAVLGLDLASAERVVQARRNTPLKNVAAAKTLLPEVSPELMADTRVSVDSHYYQITGRLRLDERVMEQRSLVHKSSAEGFAVKVLRRERVSSLSEPG